ncbi:MAG: 1-acyl-sn-glycerol-3-phosphate acyltransferase [Oscillospiraceae bacterium]|nr:1-acyl-sn-glycerol-3-phosphate acyltransferase [Oscillospiraceae bacterium]
MILYVYLIIGCVAGLVVPFAADMMGSFADVWKIILLILAFTLGLVVLHLVVAVIMCLFIDKKKEPETLKNAFRPVAMSTLDAFLKVAGVDIQVTGFEKLPNEPFMMVCNHRSLLDAVAAVVAFRKYYVAFVSKKENIKIPVIARYMVQLGCLFLDREDTRSAVKTINRAADMIKSGMGSVAICPEGTRNTTEALLLPFHAGSYKIAQKAKCPVVVFTVWGVDEVKKHPVIKRTKVFIDVIDVVEADKVQELRSGELADMTREIMLHNLERYV